MRTLVCLVLCALLSLSLLLGCGGSSCDDIVDAAVRCKYSGITDQNKDALKESCEAGDAEGADCLVDAYEKSCTSAQDLLKAMLSCS